MRFLLGIYRTYHSGRHVNAIYHVYTMYMPCIYRSGSDIPVIYQYQEYSLYILHGYPQYIRCIHSIYSVYLLYILGIYSIFLGYTMYIYGIYIVYAQYDMRIYSIRWLVLRRRAGSHSTGSTSNHIRIAWTSNNFYFAGTSNKMSNQEYTRYIPDIFKVYTECWPVDKLLNPVAGLAPRLFIVLQPYNRAFALHLSASVPYIPGIYML